MAKVTIVLEDTPEGSVLQTVNVDEDTEKGSPAQIVAAIMLESFAVHENIEANTLEVIKDED